MTTLRTHWQRIQHYVWLVFGLGCLFFALIFWAITESDALIELDKKAETEVELQIQPEKVATMAHLGALNQEVRPLDMTSRIIVTAQHESEFRGTKFVAEMKKNYSIELFRVVEEDVLKNFLKKQLDRKPFTYLRLAGENHPEQYVLLYGQYRSQDEAQRALASLALTLPASIQPSVQAIERYQPLVNDLGSDELSSNQKLRAIKLRAVPLPKVDESLIAAVEKPPTTAPSRNATTPKSPADATTSTTVTRRDAQGNIVDVQQSNSSVEGAPRAKSRDSAPEHDLVDPFN